MFHGNTRLHSLYNKTIRRIPQHPLLLALRISQSKGSFLFFLSDFKSWMNNEKVRRMISTVFEILKIDRFERQKGKSTSVRITANVELMLRMKKPLQSTKFLSYFVITFWKRLNKITPNLTKKKKPTWNLTTRKIKIIFLFFWIARVHCHRCTFSWHKIFVGQFCELH
jgi:hypothetical protein